MRNLLAMIMLVGAVVAPIACGSGDSAEGDPLLATRIRAVLVSGTLPADDPEAAFWNDVPETRVPLLIQDVAEPRLIEAGVQYVLLRAAHDGARIAFRATWEDPDAQGLLDVDRFSDAFALQFPATGLEGPLPDAMMGEKDRPVAIVHWSFARQRRSDGLPHGVTALFPNATTDHYPPDAAPDEETRTAMRTRYSPSRAAENPVTTDRPTTAVTDLLAEGFGTLTPAKATVSSGRGIHANGSWTVVISRPLDLAGSSGTSLANGRSSMLAIAVWNGKAAHVGARKMRSSWIRIEIVGDAP
jgi:Ethylbenzene dehydrogenase